MSQHIVGDRLHIFRRDEITPGKPGVRSRTSIKCDCRSRTGAVLQRTLQVLSIPRRIPGRNYHLNDIFLEGIGQVSIEYLQPCGENCLFGQRLGRRKECTVICVFFLLCAVQRQDGTFAFSIRIIDQNVQQKPVQLRLR